ncbi:MAG: hypothetical protein JKY65_27205 [Planctomycetes bacterium]|nr:hypothetical protein [Planctomycetota bacterium]
MRQSGDLDPYQVSEAMAAEERKPRRLGCCAYLAAGAVILALLVVYGVYRAILRADEVSCAGRLHEIQVAATLYAEDEGSYPYVGGDWDATIEVLVKAGYLGRGVSCPSRDGPGGYEGFKAPFPRDTTGVLIAWDVNPHGYKPKRRLASSAGVYGYSELEFKKAMAKHERDVARVLAGRAPSPSLPAPPAASPVR